MGIKFTQDQQRVIDKRNANILVSAAAGSGKTAVLVERIVQLVTAPEKTVDIDKLLVVTFTAAAASEMRERIGGALQRKLEEDPESEHLQRQLTLIHNARITTIDSFCLDVIRNNFNDIGIDPGFRVADQGEMALLKKDVLAEILEERFQGKEEGFYHLVECFSTGMGEKALEDNILKLYEFSMSCPWPEKWLRSCAEEYCPADMEAMKNTLWMKDAMERTGQIAEDCAGQLADASVICRQPDGPYMYADLLEQEMGFLSELALKRDYEELYDILSGLTFGRLPSKKDDSVSSRKREMVKGIRSRVKDTLLHTKETYFAVSPTKALSDIKESSSEVEMLIDVTLQYIKALDEKKREKNILDFADMEHFALNILWEEQESKPTKTAVGYREHYEEILIDEYQDSNLVQEYLLKSIARVEPGCFNRFMVGDVKQSIYKFRLARPEIFMEKYDSYSREEGSCQRINLRQNFRSRREVIESVNYLFGQIMVSGLGGITYDEDAALYLGADYGDFGQNQQTELLLVEKNRIEEDVSSENDGNPASHSKNVAELSKQEMEALVISARIKGLVGSFQVTDKRSGEQRATEYRDIVILLRSNAGWDETFRKILMKEGIPAHITSKTGYFVSTEIQILLNFLRILDNPRQDIPLCAVLVSPAVGFTELELAEIRASVSQSSGEKKEEEGKRRLLLYDVLVEYGKQGGEIAIKIESFLSRLNHYRDKTAYTPIHELLSLSMEEMGFYAYMSTMPGGEQRKANMDMLLEKAVDFEQTSYHGLFHFIRYIEQMEKYDVDYGEANILDENADVVRIMSIHKSKGLEFPICFVAGMAKRFNMQDVRKSFIMDMDYGLGSDYINPEERIRAGTIRKSVIAEKMKRENIGEELRVLYVALTRAKEKLIITGVVEDVAKKLTSLAALLEKKEEKHSFSFLSSLNCYLDYILAGWIRHRCFEGILEENGIEQNRFHPMYGKGPEMTVEICGAKSLVEQKAGELLKKEYLKLHLEQKSRGEEIDRALYASIQEKFSFVYPHAVLSGLYTKTTVSELKKMGTSQPEEIGRPLFPEEEPAPYIPKFIREKEELTGTARGSAYHKVLELLDFGKAGSREEIIEQMQSLVQQGRLPEEYLRAVQPGKIERFVSSSLAKRMAEAEKRGGLYREQPFVLGVPASQIRESFPENEMILVQGIIDVYFEEEDGLVVADYKTDRVERAEELWNRYRMQLDYYGDALERLTGRKVKEKIIYSFALEKEI